MADQKTEPEHPTKKHHRCFNAMSLLWVGLLVWGLFDVFFLLLLGYLVLVKVIAWLAKKPANVWLYILLLPLPFLYYYPFLEYHARVAFGMRYSGAELIYMFVIQMILPLYLIVFLIVEAVQNTHRRFIVATLVCYGLAFPLAFSWEAYWGKVLDEKAMFEEILIRENITAKMLRENAKAVIAEHADGVKTVQDHWENSQKDVPYFFPGASGSQRNFCYRNRSDQYDATTPTLLTREYKIFRPRLVSIHAAYANEPYLFYHLQDYKPGFIGIVAGSENLKFNQWFTAHWNEIGKIVQLSEGIYYLHLWGQYCPAGQKRPPDPRDKPTSNTLGQTQ